MLVLYKNKKKLLLRFPLEIVCFYFLEGLGELQQAILCEEGRNKTKLTISVCIFNSFSTKLLFSKQWHQNFTHIRSSTFFTKNVLNWLSTPLLSTTLIVYSYIGYHVDPYFFFFLKRKTWSQTNCPSHQRHPRKEVKAFSYASLSEGHQCHRILTSYFSTRWTNQDWWCETSPEFNLAERIRSQLHTLSIFNMSHNHVDFLHLGPFFVCFGTKPVYLVLRSQRHFHDM